MNKKFSLNIPHFTQLQEKDSVISEWERRICGIVCIKMCIEYFKGISPEIEELLGFKDKLFKYLSLSDGEEKSIPYYINGTGWLHYGLIAIAKEYGLHGVCDSGILIKDYIEYFKSHIEKNKGILASVTLDFKDTQNKGGHLIVIKGINEKANQTFLHINDPIRNKDLKINLLDFKKSFSGSFILISDDFGEENLANYPIFINETKVGGDNTCYFHIHENENLAYTETMKFIEDNGGIIFSLHQNQERFIRFQIKNNSGEKIFLRIDPNRIFDDNALRGTILARNRHLAAELLPEAFRKGIFVRDYILGKIEKSNSKKLVGVHTNKYLNINDFVGKNKFVYSNTKISNQAFIIVSSIEDFNRIKLLNTNVIFFEEGEDDGSLGGYLQKAGKRYFTIETGENDSENYRKLLEIINQL